MEQTSGAVGGWFSQLGADAVGIFKFDQPCSNLTTMGGGNNSNVFGAVAQWSQGFASRTDAALAVTPTPYTLHPTPYTLLPTPYTLHPTP